jgi:hypothetical protein
MPNTGTVKLKDIVQMLDACAPGARIEAKPHHNWVYCKGDLPPYRLPRGKHGKRDNPDIETGHVKRMARYFGILDRAQEHLQL